MTEPKDKNPGKKNEDWDFTGVRHNVKKEAGPKLESRAKDKVVSSKKANLVLNEAALPKTKTRSAMASEMHKEDPRGQSDLYSLASIPKRGIALFIDLAFLAAIFYVIKFTGPLWRQVMQLFLDKYNLQLWIPERFVLNGILIVTGFIALNVCIVFPVTFFNHSLGKKLLGLKIRGQEQYTLTIGQIFGRELIVKPLSILLLAGFITPFFAKKRASLHDMASHTFVIEK